MQATLRRHSARMILVLALLISTVGVGVAVAHHTREIATYDLIVPPLSGDAWSGPLTKVGPTRAVDNNTSIIGGSRQIWTMVYRGMTRVTERHLISSGVRIPIPYRAGQNLPGPDYRLKHETRLFERAHVRTRGSWSPDER